MTIGDSSSELGLNALTPSASLRADDGLRSVPQEGEQERKVRRRAGEEQPEGRESEETSLDAGDSPAHKLDHLA